MNIKCKITNLHESRKHADLTDNNGVIHKNIILQTIEGSSINWKIGQKVLLFNNYCFAISEAPGQLRNQVNNTELAADNVYSKSTDLEKMHQLIKQLFDITKTHNNKLAADRADINKLKIKSGIVI